MRILITFFILLSISIQAQEKPTKESRKRDSDVIEAKIVKKREEIKLKKETTLKERKIRQIELDKKNQKEYEEFLKTNK